MTTRPFTSTALDEIAKHLVSERDTHRILDSKFAELSIPEPHLEPSTQEEGAFKAMGLQRGVHYSVMGLSKRTRLRHALDFLSKRSGSPGVFELIKALNGLEIYSRNPEEFREFCNGLNRILRFYGVEYRDDGEFHKVDPTRTLSEAERRAAALENKLASRRIHHQVHRYCKVEYLAENYFHAVVEAYKGLAERIRELTGCTSDGLQLMRDSFERPESKQGEYPILAFNALTTVTEKNEHDGVLDFLNGCTRFFRNPMSHTPKVNWHRDVNDAVDCLTLISLLHFILDDCHPTNWQQY